MEYLSDKVSYIKGLADGLELDEKKPEGKIIKKIIEVLDDFVEAIDELDTLNAELDEQVQMIDEDLEALEDEFYDSDCDCDCDCDEDDVDFIEASCPHCNETIYLDESVLTNCEDTITCPNCNEEIEIEFDCDCENCDECE